MTTFHAIVWIDHSEAHVLMFDREHAESQRIKSRSHHTTKHSPANHKEFFAAVAKAVDGVHEVLVSGPAQAKYEFRDECKASHPGVFKTIVDVVNTDHPTDAQLVAMARKYFAKHDAMGADPTQR